MTISGFSTEIQQQANVFDNIGTNYETVFGHNPTQIAAINWLIERLPVNANVLDLGSGTGVPTAKILTEAGHSVVGLDISKKMVEIAQQQVPSATFHQMNMSSLQLAGESFQAITAFFSLLMLRKSAIESALAGLTLHLQAPGYLVLSMIEGDMDYVPIPFIGQTAHVSAYPRDDLAKILKAKRFTVLNMEAVEFQANAEAPLETQLFFHCQYTSERTP